MIRFHLDEHVHPAIAVGLRAHGIEVTTTADTSLLQGDDAEHLVFALAEERVVVTHDDDFLRLHQRNVQHAGIAYCHQEKYSVSQLLQMLRLLAACYDEKDMTGRVEFL